MTLDEVIDLLIDEARAGTLDEMTILRASLLAYELGVEAERRDARGNRMTDERPIQLARQLSGIWGHLDFELRQLKGIIQEIYARGDLSEEQDGCCYQAFKRLDYLRQVARSEGKNVFPEPGPDVVSGPTT